MSIDSPKYMKRLSDLLAMRRVLHPKDFGVEAKLVTTKWFAYSFMSPVEATEEFARVYTASLKRYVRRHFGDEDAKSAFGVQAVMPASRTRQFTQLWHARQKADGFGVPYEVLFDFGFDFAGRVTRRRYPLPHQLFATEKSDRPWWEKFSAGVEEHVELATGLLDMPHYRLEHDLGLPVQDLFRRLIMEDLLTSIQNPVDHIGWIAVKNRYLAATECLSIYSPERAGEISNRLTHEIEAGRVESEQKAELDDDDLLMTCFGIHEAIDSPESSCSACPLKVRCRNAAHIVTRITEKQTGSISPIRAADQERNRRKVAAHRARKKEAAALADASALAGS
jgi:hypothetical protein